MSKGRRSQSAGAKCKENGICKNAEDENWLPFINKFKVEIDKTDLPPVTKFAYLKELLEPKVRADIDGLPLTIEGYERAKNIIKEEYGKISEIVNTHIHNILELPTVTNTDPKQVNDFYKMLNPWKNQESEWNDKKCAR